MTNKLFEDVVYMLLTDCTYFKWIFIVLADITAQILRSENNYN